jgi:hypothetical protein
MELLEEELGNPSSPHSWGGRSREVVESARSTIASFLGCLEEALLVSVQSLNPSIPGIVDKLSPPLKKSPLTGQTRWWKAALLEMPAESCCIYYGARFDPKDIALDHFLPWSFVAHDRLWNLVPVSRRVNSCKLDKLPSLDYIEPLAHIQHAALLATANAWEEKRWLKTVEPFMLDLKLGRDALLRESELRDALCVNMKPLFEIAKAQGFISDWAYTQ